MTWQRLIDTLVPGMRVFMPTMSNESTVLTEALRAMPERARDVTFTGVQFPGIDTVDYLALHAQARQTGFFMSKPLRAGIAEGRAELMALDYIGLTRHLRNAPPPDLAIAHLSLPDADGYCSAGLAADFLPLVWSRATRRVAHLNPRMPRTRGSFRVHLSELDAHVEADAALLDYPDAVAGDVEQRIGAHAATLVRDGDTLQFGIGSVPMALAGALASHRRLRFHGGLISSGLRTLWEAEAIDRDAPIHTGVILGDSKFHDFAVRLEPVFLRDVSFTHNPAVLGAIPRFIAINSAIEVDLFGQVNAERAGGAIQAGAGGLPAFAQGAQASPGGRLLICLNATARKGTVSRIVPALGDQGLCTLPRSLADAVVTENGVAQLRDLSVEARAQALIGIAAPAHRDALAAQWQAMQRTL